MNIWEAAGYTALSLKVWIIPLAKGMTLDINNNRHILLCSDEAASLPSTRHTLELLFRGANRLTLMMIHL